MFKELFKLPNRTPKPRNSGLTMVIDKGLSTGATQQMLEVGSEYIDYVKLAWGSPLLIPHLERKLAQYQEYQIPVSLGGVLFELALMQNKLEQLVKVSQEMGIQMIEVSEGCLNMEQAEKLDYIAQLSESFTVLSEFGSPNPNQVSTPNEWAFGMQAELKAGAWKVIAEGRSSGTVGIYHADTRPRIDIIDAIVDANYIDDVIWEAPLKSQQNWFIKTFGSNVNLGNIHSEQIIALEAVRLGLRSDTLEHFHRT